jgi:hypothetical protein
MHPVKKKATWSSEENGKAEGQAEGKRSIADISLG